MKAQINNFDMEEVRKVRVAFFKKKRKEKKEETNNVMGVDLSKFSTGIAILNELDEILFLNKISPKGNNDKYLIIDFIISMKAILEKYRPSTVIMEDIYLKNSFGKLASFKSLAKQHGIILTIFAIYDIDVKYIHNMSAKSFVGCKNKEDVFKRMCELYSLDGFNFEDHNDLTDALMLALNKRNGKLK